MTAPKRTSRDVGLRQLASGSWQARYRDGDGKPQQRVFPTKREAKAWRAAQVASVLTGSHVAPNDRTTVAEYAARWIEARPIRASTRKRYRGMLAAHLVDEPLGSRRLNAVTVTDVQQWVTGRSVVLAPSSLGRVFTFVAGIFKAAQADRLIVWSPCVGVRLPEAPPIERTLVTEQQVERLAAEVPPRYSVLVEVLGTLGLRIGEALALRVDDLDRERGVLRVERTLEQKALSAGPVKRIATSRREVPVPGWLLARLAAHQLAHPPGRHGNPALDGLLFTSAHGRPLRYDVLMARVWKPAAARAGVPDCTPHALRHLTGSTLIHDGVPPTTVARILGHSLETLLSTYAHALPSGDDLARSSMERRAGSGMRVARTGLSGV